MIRRNRNQEVEGHFCLPTSSRYHVLEPERSSAFAKDQWAYVLANDRAYPERVVLTSFHELPLNLGEEIKTQHAEVRKQLPVRIVEAVRHPDGRVEGPVPPRGQGLPHWEFVPLTSEGKPDPSTISELEERLHAARAGVANAARVRRRRASEAPPTADKTVGDEPEDEGETDSVRHASRDVHH